ncbi:phage fiber-tail adaptor protein [Acetobacter oryzifermentans]|uniref:Uncharacterized protein n=1 Tax=Acetobacter oryzifermentans TaxID=1633874 RepID=A0ABM6AKD6_9PROT|nr:hypothetical protein [Acetobacter oryzifermentans]ANA14162.1 hypothetical protein WG31_09215 [Acetobacter oryzifermentans]
MTAPIPSPNWYPAPGRTLLLPSMDQVRGAVTSPPTQLVWPKKTSADNLDYSLDPSDWLSGTSDYLANIESVEITTSLGEADDLKCLWSSIVNGMACLMIGSGQPGTQQNINVRLLTQQGRRAAVSILLPVSNALSATAPQKTPTLSNGTPIPPNSIQLAGGSILLGDNDQPLLIA